MKGLEEYIRADVGAFDDKEVPEGHEERFEAKLDAFRVAVPKRRGWAVAMTGVAAAVAAVIFVGRPAEKDWFAGVGENPVEIYEAYNERVADLYMNIFIKHPDGSMEDSAVLVAEENIPLIDLLPDEIDETQKAAILKEYYSALLDGLERLNKVK